MLTFPQVEYFLAHLPLIEARRHYGVASLTAAVKNMMGGKPDPKKKGEGTIPTERMYTPEEELPFYAWFREPERGRQLSRDAALDLMRNIKHLPDWARQIAPFDEAERALSASN